MKIFLELNEITKLLDQEVKLYESMYPKTKGASGRSKSWEQGFIAGLRQAEIVLHIACKEILDNGEDND